jgi:ubiquinone/menaquinone biosynthesis C-methylase UbiE
MLALRHDQRKIVIRPLTRGASPLAHNGSKLPREWASITGMAHEWFLDELAHAGPEHLDPAFVAGYDRKRGTDPVDDVAVLRRHGVGAASTVVDLGAGTGAFTLVAARHLGRVVAVDVSPAMLSHLRARLDQAGLDNVECVRAGFLSYEHAGAPVDAVYTRHALHQLSDFWKVLALHRIAALLRPGGLLRLRDLVFDLTPDETAARLDAWLDGAATDPAQGYTRADFAEHLRTEHSTFRWLLEPMLESVGLDIIEADYRGGIYAAYTCVKQAGRPS